MKINVLFLLYKLNCAYFTQENIIQMKNVENQARKNQLRRIKTVLEQEIKKILAQNRDFDGKIRKFEALRIQENIKKQKIESLIANYNNEKTNTDNEINQLNREISRIEAKINNIKEIKRQKENLLSSIQR